VVAYLNAAITDDWPAMERGTTSPVVTRALNNLYAAVLGFNSGENRDTALLSEILYQLDQSLKRVGRGASLPPAMFP
jgi:hypothetical protein